MITTPLIVAATFHGDDFRWLDGLRRAHYPAERNLVPVHLTLFHHLPPSELRALRQRLGEETRGVPPPKARLSAIRLLGRGVAFDVHAPELLIIRDRLADSFERVLIPQDRASWRPHVTIQNKVEPSVARSCASKLGEGFKPRPLGIKGLGLWAYQQGPWLELGHYPFG